MSCLLDLATETFNDLVQALDIFDLTRLWLCGDRRIQWRLSEGKGVRSVSIYVDHTSKAFWPTAILHFSNLEAFSLKIHHYSNLPDNTALHLSSLSRNVKSLHLDTSNAFSAFNDLIAANPDAFPYLEDLSLISGIPKPQLEIDIPRTVTKLVLGKFSCPLVPLPLSFLPPNLTWLSCSIDCLEVKEVPKFPDGLLKLDIFCPGDYASLLLLSIPSSLEELHISSHSDRAKLSIADWELLSQIPLISLKLPLSRCIGPKEAKFLPSTLETLVLDCGDEHYCPEEECLAILQALPKRLKKIKLPILDDSISVSMAQSMPTMLEMDFKATVDSEACHHLPLKTKGIKLATNCDFNLLESFPPLLESLIAPDLPERISQSLPITLKRLTIESYEDILKEPLLMSFGRFLHLQELSIETSLPKSLDFNQFFQSLPRQLIVLNINTASERRKLLLTKCSFWGKVRNPSQTFLLSLESSSLLPPFLKTLQLGHVNFEQGDMASWIQRCPPTLTFLELHVQSLPSGSFIPFRSKTAIKCLTIKTITTPEDGWSNLLETLPPKLQILDLEDLSKLSDSRITKKALQKIYKKATNICLPFSSLLNRDSVQGFPYLVLALSHDGRVVSLIS